MIKIGRLLSGKARKTANLYPALSFPSVHFVVLSRLSVVVVVAVVERGLLLIVSFIYRCVTSHREKAKSWSFSLYRLKLYFQFSILTSDKATRRSGKGTPTHFMYSLHSGGWCCGFHDLVRLSVFSIAEWGVREIR